MRRFAAVFAVIVGITLSTTIAACSDDTSSSQTPAVNQDPELYCTSVRAVVDLYNQVLNGQATGDAVKDQALNHWLTAIDAAPSEVRADIRASIGTGDSTAAERVVAFNQKTCGVDTSDLDLSKLSDS